MIPNKLFEAILVAVGLPFISAALYAQSPIGPSDLHTPSKIAPDYFGPNALPVPDMVDGATSSTLKVDFAGDYFNGHRGDRTSDFFAKFIIPLFSDRVYMSLWMQVVEFYNTTEEWRTHCRLPGQVLDEISGSRDKRVTSRGWDIGDVYVSTNILVLKQTEYLPDFTIRAAFKSASGGSYFKARFFDCPGYFFDATFAKSILSSGWDNASGRESFFVKDFRLAASGGFLCWQTDHGRQNDAVMYGLMAVLDTKAFRFDLTWGGYLGWEKDGDRPMTLKAMFKGYIGKFAPYIACQAGLMDFPYNQLRIGVEYNIDIFGKARSKR